MNKDDINKVLVFWRARQREESGLHTFRFQRCAPKGKGNIFENAVYGLDKGKNRSIARVTEPPARAVVDDSLGRAWDEEYKG